MQFSTHFVPVSIVFACFRFPSREKCSLKDRRLSPLMTCLFRPRAVKKYHLPTIEVRTEVFCFSIQSISKLRLVGENR